MNSPYCPQALQIFDSKSASKSKGLLTRALNHQLWEGSTAWQLRATLLLFSLDSLPLQAIVVLDSIWSFGERFTCFQCSGNKWISSRPRHHCYSRGDGCCEACLLLLFNCPKSLSVIVWWCTAMWNELTEGKCNSQIQKISEIPWGIMCFTEGQISLQVKRDTFGSVAPPSTPSHEQDAMDQCSLKQEMVKTPLGRVSLSLFLALTLSLASSLFSREHLTRIALILFWVMALQIK